VEILIVAEKYPPTVGGGETHVYQLAEGLVALGHGTTVLTEAVAPGAERERYRTGKVQVREVVGLKAACQRLDCMRAVERLHAELASTHADIVHVFNYVPALLTSWLRPSLTGKLVVSFFETFIPDERIFDIYFHRLANYELERALQRGLVQNLRPDLHICGSQTYLRWAREAGFFEPAVVVEFGTDLAAFTGGVADRVRWRAENDVGDEFLFLVPARPVRNKRIEDAVAALARLRTTHPDVRLILTAPTDRGDEEYIEELRDLVRRSGVTDLVRWVDGLSWQAMPPLYAAADAVVLPSSHEGWGIALNEGMASGRPVITAAAEGRDEVVQHGRTGLLYPVGDHIALAETMQRVIEEDQTDMVERSRKEVHVRLSAAAMVAGHVREYQTLMGPGDGR
jgi:glycosyltransferase involved in cell wall biosynthesis